MSEWETMCRTEEEVDLSVEGGGVQPIQPRAQKRQKQGSIWPGRQYDATHADDNFQQNMTTRLPSIWQVYDS